jgi:hypothetical protein
LKGDSFTGQDKWNAPCTGNDSCISGYFTKWVSPSEAYSHGSDALDLGARVVILTA